MGIVDDLITGRDGVVRAVKLRSGKSHLKRAIQHLYPLELTCDRKTGRPGNNMNPDATEFTAINAKDRLAASADDEHDF